MSLETLARHDVETLPFTEEVEVMSFFKFSEFSSLERSLDATFLVVIPKKGGTKCLERSLERERRYISGSKPCGRGGDGVLMTPLFFVKLAKRNSLSKFELHVV
ncbi:hypothetical protein CK203_023088 [Vitis vinifera]|uniref:Uncharacterized protein n=1 Tax=Vitis vinifera TaxID=29760 RepID=A0A438J3Y4_VITVI|nr:hypothetical protein CK203_023088 [Vitis vinifera]